MESIFTIALDSCRDANSALTILHIISRLSTFWARWATDLRRLYCLTVRNREDLRSYARLTAHRAHASQALRVLIMDLDLGEDTHSLISPSNLRSFFPRMPNLKHLVIRYKPLPIDPQQRAITLSGELDARNICGRNTSRPFWQPLEQVIYLYP